MTINNHWIVGVSAKKLVHKGANQTPNMIVIHYSVTDTVAEAVASSGEFGEWRTEFLASLKDLEAASKAGTEDVSRRLRSIVEEAERQAGEAKTAAESAKNAAKVAVAATEPGFINVRIVSNFDDEVVVSVDGTVKVASRSSEVVLERVPPGPRTISASATHGGIGKGAARAVDVRPGIQDLEIELK